MHRRALHPDPRERVSLLVEMAPEHAIGPSGLVRHEPAGTAARPLRGRRQGPRHSLTLPTISAEIRVKFKLFGTKSKQLCPRPQRARRRTAIEGHALGDRQLRGAEGRAGQSASSSLRQRLAPGDRAVQSEPAVAICARPTRRRCGWRPIPDKAQLAAAEEQRQQKRTNERAARGRASECQGSDGSGHRQAAG